MKEVKHHHQEDQQYDLHEKENSAIFSPLTGSEASVRALVLYVHVLDTYHYVVSRSTVIQHTTWDREIRETQRTTVLFAHWRRSQRVFSCSLKSQIGIARATYSTRAGRHLPQYLHLLIINSK